MSTHRQTKQYKESIMPAMTLAKSGKRYTHEEWVKLDADERIQLLSMYGPGYTDEAWKKHYGNRKKNK
jgi:hypothetical protein